MIVRLTEQAESDLEDIALFIARDDRDRALSFAAELREACADLADSPTRFRLIDRPNARGVRRRLVGKYLIFFRIVGEEVRVTRILHGARDYAALGLLEE